jgi:hypothetical protein
MRAWRTASGGPHCASRRESVPSRIQAIRRLGQSVLVTFLACINSPVYTQVQPPKVLDQPATVIGHLPLPQKTVTGIHLRQRGGKKYAYLETSGNPGIIVVNITKPKKPVIVNQVNWPGDAPSGTLTEIGHGLAVAESSSDPSPVPRTVNVLDVSHPAHPRVIQTFSGITALTVSADHNLLLFANNEGLSVLAQHWAQPPVYPCTSGAVMIPNPNCE